MALRCPTPHPKMSSQGQLGVSSQHSALGHWFHVQGIPAVGTPLFFSEPAARTSLGSWDLFSDHRSHHRDVGQSHGGCGPGTALYFLSMAHGHGCSQAGWLCRPLDVSQALAPGSCCHQPEESEGDSHTEVLGGAEGQEMQSYPMIPHFFSSCHNALGPWGPKQLPLSILPNT